MKIAFVKFWQRFDPEDNLFTRLLRESYEVEISDRPEFAFYSVFPGPMPTGGSTKIFYTGENVRAPWGECDWAFSSDYDDRPQHFRLPNFVFEARSPGSLVKGPFREPKQEKTKWCNFVYSNPVPFRNRFFKELSRSLAIDAPGRCMHNTPPIGKVDHPLQSRYASDWAEAKVAWLAPYRFSIAFENSSHPGYTTEKIYHAMQAETIPIYWGNPLVGRDFNSKSFVNYHDDEAEIRARMPSQLTRSAIFQEALDALVIRPRTTRRVIRRVTMISRDKELYLQYLKEPWFPDNTPPACWDMNRLSARLKEIVCSRS